MKTTDKGELIRLARLASAPAKDEDFWEQVARLEDEDSRKRDELVKPRREREN